MKRAINLARVSTPRQADLYSLDYQLEQERAYCAEMGFTVVAEFKDDTTGRKLDRDGLEEACRMLEADEADVLVTWKFDRLHRNYVNSVLLRERIRKAGKEVHYAQSKTVSGKTARERLPEDLQFILAEIDADDILERTTQGRLQKIKAGKWLGVNKPPYGYVKKGQGKTAEPVVDDLEDQELRERLAAGEVVPEVLSVLREGKATAVVVRWIFVWYLRGFGEEGPLSTGAIADKLEALGIPSPQDLLPNRQHLKARGYASWSRTAIYSLLRQSAYRGIFINNRQKIINGKHTRNPNKADHIGVPVPAIIDEALFQAAELKLQQGKIMSNRGSKYEALMGRRLKCECGYAMQSHPAHKPYTKKNGETVIYKHHKYKCPGRSRSLGLAHSCDMPTVDVVDVDTLVWQWVKEEIANPEILKRKLEEIQAEQRAGQEGMLESLDTLYQHRAELEKQLTELGKLYLTDMPKHIVEGLISEQSHKLSLTNDEIRKREQEKDSPLSDDTITTLVGLSWQLSEHLAVMEDSFDAKRVVIDNLDVRARLVRRNRELWLELQSILRPDVVSRTLSNTL
jgi:site-specific DNA recombinase